MELELCPAPIRLHLMCVGDRRTLRPQPQHRGVSESLLEDVEDDARPGFGQGSPGNMMHRRVSHWAESSAEIRQAVLNDRAQRRRCSSPSVHREQPGSRGRNKGRTLSASNFFPPDPPQPTPSFWHLLVMPRPKSGSHPVGLWRHHPHHSTE